MRFTMRAAIAVSSLLFAASAAAESSENILVARASMSLVGCFDSDDGLTNKTTYTYQSSGWCFDACTKTNAAVFGLTGGSDCLCGDELPPDSAKVSKDKCNKACDGWPSDKCGGDGFYSVYKTGLNPDVSSGSSSPKSSGKPSTKTDDPAPAESTQTVGGTTVVTPVSENKDEDEDAKAKSSHNTAAVAAGAVVGVVGFAALVGAGIFFYRSKKQKAQSQIGGYGNESGMPSMSDSRFDGNYMAQRRQSNGSIDDDHDFSRRVLQVTNPDR
ncbi:hypothetical protein NUU61_008139 [Penicillium alfredii]|uniref:WSC domain-containing protein n=1 Tax=Penicillium alfredii TaxID=1506179 RepID=A0A9W9ERW2_9EURO|nr:uncharacterized protein NUU61_008139 [Penicillium alfredii]KAJ5086832.1 hypothetical protein NUU61_008139 [Penicillium alfredii]